MRKVILLATAISLLVSACAFPDLDLQPDKPAEEVPPFSLVEEGTKEVPPLSLVEEGTEAAEQEEEEPTLVESTVTDESPTQATPAQPTEETTPIPPVIEGSARPRKLRAPVNVTLGLSGPIAPTAAEPKVDKYLPPGTYVVGRELEAGLYYIKGEPQEVCKWRKQSEPDIMQADITALIEFVSATYVEVKETDRVLFTSCPIARVKEMPQTLKLVDILPPGTYLMGVDIAPGRYVFDANTTPNPEVGCSVRGFSGFTGDPAESVLWRIWDTGRFFVNVPSNIVALMTTCYGRKTTLEEDLKRPKRLPENEYYDLTPPPANVKFYSQGNYAPGEIPAGVYRNFTADAGILYCNVKRLRGDQIVGGPLLAGRGYVEITKEDAVELNAACALVPIEQLTFEIDRTRKLYPAGGYLVGKDLPPGRYRVETSRTLKDECTVGIYRSALYPSTPQENRQNLIASYGFQDGEYFFDVLEGDYLVDARCPIELVESK